MSRLNQEQFGDNESFKRLNEAFKKSIMEFRKDIPNSHLTTKKATELFLKIKTLNDLSIFFKEFPPTYPLKVFLEKIIGKEEYKSTHCHIEIFLECFKDIPSVDKLIEEYEKILVPFAETNDYVEIEIFGIKGSDGTKGSEKYHCLKDGEHGDIILPNSVAFRLGLQKEKDDVIMWQTGFGFMLCTEVGEIEFGAKGRPNFISNCFFSYLKVPKIGKNFYLKQRNKVVLTE